MDIAIDYESTREVFDHSSKLNILVIRDEIAKLFTFLGIPSLME